MVDNSDGVCDSQKFTLVVRKHNEGGTNIEFRSTSTTGGGQVGDVGAGDSQHNVAVYQASVKFLRESHPRRMTREQFDMAKMNGGRAANDVHDSHMIMKRDTMPTQLDNVP